MEHSTYKAQLAELTASLLRSEGCEQEIDAAKGLSAFYARFMPVAVSASHPYQRQNEVQLKGGFALSSFDAAICIDEYIRTARFLKGVHMAICEVLDRFEGRKINILYAGCGPYATLILPLLPLFGPDQLDLLLLDINDDSLKSVSNLLTDIGLGGYTVNLLKGNAIQYQTPASRPLHLVVSETMFRALIREPQVAITENLAPQLVDGGLLIPQQIHVDMGFSFFGKEPFLQTGSDRAAGCNYPQRLVVDRLFSINKELFFFKGNKLPGVFESGSYEVPADFGAHPDLCLFTSLQIFRDVMLHSAESSITNPHCITSLYSLSQPAFKLVYDFRDIPAWTFV